MSHMHKSRRKLSPDLRGCPICGSKNKKVISGFVVCADCNHRVGEGGLGRETERRGDDGAFYNAADHRYGATRLPDADSQVKTPKPRGRPYRREL